ncbi:MAG: hypothetical protein HKL80_07555, partial [Acidimicrobiales bacterium]|nr:hypothetical protein [Acidimicrobiales bacterium]
MINFSKAKSVFVPVLLVLLSILAGLGVSTNASAVTPNVSWSNISSQKAAISNIASVACPSASDCFVLASTSTNYLAIFATTNGGSTWSRQSTPAINLNVGGGIACESVSNCIAVTSQELISTTNGGSTWTASNLPTGVSVNDIFCTNAICVAVGAIYGQAGESAYAATTSDLGQTWSASSGLPANVQLNEISCFQSGSLDCMAVGLNTGTNAAAIEITTNGATSWRSSTVSNGITTLTSVGCSSSTTCNVVGFSNTFNLAGAYT